MSQCNVAITDVKLTPNPVIVGAQYIVSVKVDPVVFEIATFDGFSIAGIDGNTIACMEE